MPKVQRSPPVTPTPSLTTQSKSAPQLDLAVPDDQIENAHNIHITTRNKRLRPADSPENRVNETDQAELTKFKNDLWEMLNAWQTKQDQTLNSWKAEQDSTLSKLVQDINDVKARCQEIKNSNTEIEKGMAYINTGYEEMRQRVEKLELERQTNLAYITNLENKLQDNDFKSRSATIELRNVPNKDNEKSEDLAAVISKVGQLVKVSLQQADLRDIYRLPGKPGTTRPIVAEFNCVKTRNDLLSSVRNFNKERPVAEKLNTHSIDLGGEKKPIYLDEHLTPALKKLLYDARQIAKLYNYSCWQSHGKAFGTTGKEKNILRKRLNLCKAHKLVHNVKFVSEAVEVLQLKIIQLVDLIEKFTREKKDTVQRLSSLLKSVPINNPRGRNPHDQLTNKVNVAFEGQKTKAVIADTKEIPTEVNSFLTRLIQLRRQELGFCERQRSLGHSEAERAHVACYQLLEAIINLIQPYIGTHYALPPNCKLLNALLERFPPRLSRVEVTLDEEYVARLASETSANSHIKFEFKPVEPTTIVTTGDGGSGDQHERNFTRRLNTIIEFECGTARNSAANQNFLKAKYHLACVSALIARPSGLKHLLDQLTSNPVLADSNDNLDPFSKSLVEASESKILVSNIIRSIHIQIGATVELEDVKPPEGIVERKSLIGRANHLKKYFTQTSLAEFVEGRSYGLFGNLLLAGYKCVLGCDLAEKAAHLNSAIHKPDSEENLLALHTCLLRYKGFVPEDYRPVPQKPIGTPKYLVPKNPEKNKLKEAEKLPIANTPKAPAPNKVSNFSLLLPRDLKNNKPQNWYPARFGPASKNNMEASKNIVMKMLPGKVPPQPVTQSSATQPQTRTPAQPLPQDVQLRHAGMSTVNPSPQQRQVHTAQQHERVVQNNMMQTPSQFMNQQPSMGINLNHSYPKGVPKSFLVKQWNNAAQNPGEPNNAPIWPTQSSFQQSMFAPTYTAETAPTSHGANTQLFVQTERPVASQTTQYSPTEMYETQDGMYEDEDNMSEDETGDGSESPRSGQKRLSAFHRLGPVTAPKKRKLTINLLFSKDDAVREVVNDESEASKRPEPLVPVPKRPDVLNSTDDTVTSYLPSWPWQNKVTTKRVAAPRTSKSAMIMEEEQMIEGYESNRHYIKVMISKYPSFYTKEDVLDLVLETVTGKSFIPCFIEFNRHECTFLVLRSVKALLALHKKGLYLHENGVAMPVEISLIDLNLNNIGFIPRIVLGKRLASAYDGEMKLNLESFCLQSDVSHFIYFPLNRPTNQMELVQLQSSVSWEHLRELNLAGNRLTTLEGFELPRRCPKLQTLDLSNNFIERLSAIVLLRGLPLSSLRLEGNPLCNDYTDPREYVRVVRMMFPTVTLLDEVKIHLPGTLPPTIRHYCPEDALRLVDTYLSVHCALLDAPPDQRASLEGLYHEQATLSVTYCPLLRSRPVYRQFRELFARSRMLTESRLDCIEGAAVVARHVARWPPLAHDPDTFVVDVLHYDETNAIIRVSGVLKVTSETLAEDEPLVSFTRTVVMRAPIPAHYMIHNETVHWDEPTPEIARRAFQLTTLKPRKLSLKLESPPDEDLKSQLTTIFMKVTNLNRKLSDRCLEIRNWDIKLALEHFMKLLKLNSVSTLDVGGD